MSAIDEARTVYTHDTNLFMSDGKPIMFCMRPCRERARIRGFIDHGGGKISSTHFKDSIKLIPPDRIIFEGTVYTTDYIFDCVKENRRVDMEKYKRTEQVSDGSDGECIAVKTVARTYGRRVEYSYPDDQKIINYIIEHKLFQAFKGNSMWILMEQSGVLARSWQSLKQRFLKKILPSIGSYSLSKEIIRRFKNKGSSDSSDDSVQEGNIAPKKYTNKEDTAILDYIIHFRLIDETKGNQIWQKMEKSKITVHTWQSMKERFRKHIVRKLHTFDISQYNRATLEEYYNIESRPSPKKYEDKGDDAPDSTVSSPRPKRRKEEIVFDAAQPFTSNRRNLLVSKKPTEGIRKIYVVDDHQQPSTSKGVVHDVSKDLHRNISPECSASQRIAASGKTSSSRLEAVGCRELATSEISGLPGPSNTQAVPTSVPSTSQTTGVSLPSDTLCKRASVSHSPKPASTVAHVKKSHRLKRGKQALASRKIFPVLLDPTPEVKTSSEVIRQRAKRVALITEDPQRPSENSVDNSESRVSHAEEGLRQEADSECHRRRRQERRQESPVIASSVIGRRALLDMSQSLETPSQPMKSPEKNLNVELVVPEATRLTDDASLEAVSIKTSEKTAESSQIETVIQVGVSEAIVEEEPVVVTVAVDPVATINDNGELIVGLEEQVGVEQDPANDVALTTVVAVSPLVDEIKFNDESNSDCEVIICSSESKTSPSESSKLLSLPCAQNNAAADCGIFFEKVHRQPVMHSIVGYLGEKFESEFNSWITSKLLTPSPVLNCIASEHTEQERLHATVEPALVEIESKNSEGGMPVLEENNSDNLEEEVAHRVEEDVADHVEGSILSTDAEESFHANVEDNLHDYAGIEEPVPANENTSPDLAAKGVALDGLPDLGHDEHSDDKTNSIGSQDSLESIERPEALDKMLNGCTKLSTEEGFQILKWSGVQLNMDKKTLLNYYRGIIAHDFDTLLENVQN